MRTVACVLCALSTLLVLSFATAAPAAQAASARVDGGERAVVRVINRARAADAHTRSMLRSDYFSHGAFSQRLRRYVSFRRIGETIAMATRCSARKVVRMWLNSPPHRAVLLSRGFRRIGVGRRKGRLGARPACVVTADFASRR